MRFPRVNRLRWDKPPGEADRLETLEKMLDKTFVPLPGDDHVVAKAAAGKS